MISIFSSIKNNFISCLKTGVITTLSALTAIKVANYIESYATEGMIPGYVCGSGLIGENICRFGSVGVSNLPLCAERIDWLQPLKPAFWYMGAAINIISALPACYLFGFEAKSVLKTALIAAGEEIALRGLFQCSLLRKVQAMILKQVSENHEALLDRPLAQISRIMIASALFALMHAEEWECGSGGTVPEFAAGIIFGIIAENSGIISSSLAHIQANLILVHAELIPG